nr:HAD family hydrolase [Ardenticatena sp.]
MPGLDHSRIDAILFDLDGTLLALRGGEKGGTLATYLRPFTPILPGRNPEQFMRRLWVLTETPTNYVLAILDRLGLDTWLRPLADRARRAKGIGTLENLAPIEGAMETVQALASRYRLGVLTNRARRETFAFLDQSGLRPYFGAITTRQDLWRFKPHPQAVRRTAHLLNVPPERVLMVGDMPVDMETARRAGAQAVGVLTGFATAEELHAAGATIILPSVCDLPPILFGQSSREERP